MFIRNVGNIIPGYTTSHLERQQFIDEQKKMYTHFNIQNIYLFVIQIWYTHKGMSAMLEQMFKVTTINL
jgi:hypothetical protein